MASRTISTRLAIEGESEYKQSIANINSALGAQKAALSAVKAEYASSANTMDALRAKSEALSAVQETQSAKLKEVSAALENAKKAQQQYAEKVAECKNVLAVAEAAQEKASNTAGTSKQALDALSATVEQYKKALSDAERYQQAAQRGVYDWQRQHENAVKAIRNTSAEIAQCNKYLEEAQKSADGCAASIDQFGKKVKQTVLELDEAGQALDKFQGTAGTVGENLNKMGNTLTVGLTTPLVAAGTAAYHYASDTAESLNKVETAFGYAAGGVKRWSETTLTSIGLARGTALDMAALFGDMATSMGFADEEAAGMSRTLVNLAGDLASFKNISIDQAQTALKSIFTGETESLKELGVVMTQTNLDAYAMAQGFKTAFSAMDQTQQVALRYQYVLEQTQNAQGDFARTSEGAANQARILQESLKEAAAAAGEDLLPVITPIITNLGHLAQSFGDLDEGTRKAVVKTGLFLAALGPMLKLTGGLATAVKTGAAAYAVLTAAKAADTAATVGQATATTAATAAQTGLNAAMTANPIGIVITAIGMLVAGLASLALTTALTGEKQEDFNAKLRDTVERSEAAVSGIQEDTAAKTANLDAVAELLPKIEELNSKTSRTSEEQHELNGLVEVANGLYPGLIGQVDALTGAYDFNRQAIEDNIEALKRKFEFEANQDIIEEKYRALAELKLQLNDATDAFAPLQEKVEELQTALDDVRASGDQGSIEGFSVSLYNAKNQAESAKTSVSNYEAQIVDLEQEIDTLMGFNIKLAGSMQQSGAAADEAAEAYDGFAAGLAAFSSVIGKVQGGYELLTKAQQEMTDTGYLSSSTISTLLEQYPTLSGYLVEVADGYQLSQGALEDYIAAQKTEYQLAYDEAASAAQSIIDAEVQKRGAIVDTTLSIEQQLQALATMYDAMAKSMGAAAGVAGSLAGSITGVPGDVLGTAMNTAAQSAIQKQADSIRTGLAQLRAASDNLGNFDRAASSLARDRTAGGRGARSSSSSSGSGKGKTQEEQDLETYRQMVKDLEYQRNLDLISEETFYKHKGALAQRYLAAGSEERKAWDVEFYNYQKEAYARDLAELQRQLEAREITRDQYDSSFLTLEEKFLEKGSQEQLDAEKKRKAFQEESYREKMADQQYFREMGLIGDTEYYIALGNARDKYLEEDSDAWRKATLELNNWRRQAQQNAADETIRLLEEQFQREQAAMDRQEQAIQEDVEKRIALIKEEQAAEEGRLNALIDGIDQEIAARRRLRQEESDEDKVAQAQRRLEAAQGVLEMARTEAERAEAAKEVTRREQELEAARQAKEDNDWYYQKEQEKAALEDQLERVRQEYQARIDGAEDEVRKEWHDAEMEAVHNYNAEQERKRREEASLQETRAAASAARALLSGVEESAAVLTQVANTITKTATANVNITTTTNSLSGTQRVVERAMDRVLRKL